MTLTVADLVERIRLLEADLDVELAKRSAELKVGMEKGRIVFEEEVLRRQEEMRRGLWDYVHRARLLVMLTAPVLYLGIIPFLLLDLFVTLYQAICFPVYGLEKVKRSQYLIFDRRHLGYLNALEKLNCAYCSYANGLIAYAREIAGRTERYWCPIKHARRVVGAHPHYHEFADFGDAQAYRKDLEAREAAADVAGSSQPSQHDQK